VAERGVAGDFGFFQRPTLGQPGEGWCVKR
jgi:hypothetical protein